MIATNRQLDYARCKTKYRWRSVDIQFPEWGRERVTLVFGVKGGHYLVLDVCKQSPVRLPRSNTKNCWHSVDGHFQDGAGSMSLCWLGCQPIHRLWMAATNRHLGYTRCTAKNQWSSLDANFQNEAVTMCYTLLPRKAASTLVMDSSNQVTFQLRYLQD